MVENSLLLYKKKLVRKEVTCKRKEKENYTISIFVSSSPGGVWWQHSQKHWDLLQFFSFVMVGDVPLGSAAGTPGWVG